MRQHVSVSIHADAPCEQVFALVKDGFGWPAWSMFDSFALERQGQGDPLGVGAIRVFATRFIVAREEVVRIVENRSLTYTLLSGLPLRDYEATFSVAADPAGGSSVRWTADFGPQAFSTRLFWRLFIGSVLQRTVNDLAKAAEARR